MYLTIIWMVQSAGALEYTDSISADSLDTPRSKCILNMAQKNLRVRLQ